MAVCAAGSFALSSSSRYCSTKIATIACDKVRLGLSHGARSSAYGGESLTRRSSSGRRYEDGSSAIRSSRSMLWGGTFQVQCRLGESMQQGIFFGVGRALAEVMESKGLAYDGPGKGGQWLSSTTRHVRIYIGAADPATKKMDQSQLDKITLMLDPDNEFLWPRDKVQKVYDYFAELVEGYAGAPVTEYTLRLIGSDIEHYIRKLLLANEIKYNLDCRVLNFSMGKPRYESGIIDEGEESFS